MRRGHQGIAHAAAGQRSAGHHVDRAEFATFRTAAPVNRGGVASGNRAAALLARFDVHIVSHGDRVNGIGLTSASLTFERLATLDPNRLLVARTLTPRSS